jgi:hypothetical protein
MENNNNFELPNIEKKNYLNHIDFKKIENDLNKVKYIKYQESRDDSHNTVSINFDELSIINNYTNNLPKHKIINTEV